MYDTDVWWLVFGSAFVAMALAETFRPLHALASSTPRRWLSNSMLLVVTGIVIFCAYQLSGIALASTSFASEQGLLNRLAIPQALRFLLGFAALDLLLYLGHRLMHAIAPFWRLHLVHHSETDLDLTTGFRFHPLEGIVTQGLQFAAIALLGAPPLAVAAIGIAIVIQNFFTHANVLLPTTLDRTLRWILITPAMHHIHHSEAVREQNGNFGTVFSWWDRLFRTYRADLAASPQNARYGVTEVPNGSTLSPAGLLALSFRRMK